MRTFRISILVSVIANIVFFTDSWQSAISSSVIAVVSVSAVYATQYIVKRATA